MVESPAPQRQKLSADEFRARIAEEQRQRRRNAIALAEAARSGDAETFSWLVSPSDNVDVAWVTAMRRIGRLGSVSQEIRDAFLPAWVEHKMLPLKVGDRRALADALHVLMPPITDRAPLQVYRGTRWRERARRTYGFSWTRRRETAESFADHWRQDHDGGGVILQVNAPPEAIFLVSEEGDYYDEDEDEVVLDPFRLSTVSVVERLRIKP